MADDPMDEPPAFPRAPETFPLRSPFSYRPSLSDPQLWIIGMIVAQWQMVEFYMSTHVFRMTADDPAAQDKYRKTRGFEARRDQWKDLVARNELEPNRSRFLQVIERIGSVKQERDRVVHGLMIGSDANIPGDDAGETGMSMEATATDRRNFEWRYSFERLRDTGRKIDRLIYTLAVLHGMPP